MRKTKTDPLNPNLTYKQGQFVEQMLIEPMPAKAAIAAGYSSHCAGQIATKLMQNPDIKAELVKSRKEIAMRNGITADMVIQELASIAFAQIGMFCTWDNGEMTLLSSEDIMNHPDKQRFMAAVESVTVVDNKNGRQVKLKLYSKLDALDKLARVLDLFAPDETNVNINNTIEFKDKTATLLSRLSRITAATQTTGNFVEPDGGGAVPPGDGLAILGPGQPATP